MYFLELIDALLAYGVAKDEPTILPYILQQTCKGALRITVEFPFALAVKSSAVAGGHVLTVPNGLKSHEEILEQWLAGDLPIQELTEGYRVGGIAHKYPLVYVQANANDAVLDHAALQTILDEHATEFTIADIDIIRPLDGHLSGEILLQGLTEGHRGDFRDTELTGGWQVLRMDKHREGEVHAPLRLPGVRATALPCSLVVRHDHTTSTSPLHQPVVGGIGLVDMNDLKFFVHVCKITKKIVTLQAEYGRSAKKRRALHAYGAGRGPKGL